MEKFNNISEMNAFVKTQESSLNLLKQKVSIINSILVTKGVDIGTWNHELGEYVEYTLEEVRNGQTATGQTIWLDEDEFLLKKKAWDEILSKLLTF